MGKCCILRMLKIRKRFKPTEQLLLQVPGHNFQNLEIFPGFWECKSPPAYPAGGDSQTEQEPWIMLEVLDTAPVSPAGSADPASSRVFPGNRGNGTPWAGGTAGIPSLELGHSPILLGRGVPAPSGILALGFNWIFFLLFFSGASPRIKFNDGYKAVARYQKCPGGRDPRFWGGIWDFGGLLPFQPIPGTHILQIGASPSIIPGFGIQVSLIL